MHEVSLAEGIAELVTEQARERRFARVRRVFVSVGALAHVEPRALAFAWEGASRGTPAEGAPLEIERVPGRACCMGCGEEIAVGGRGEPCGACGSYRWVVTDGDQMRVTEMEVE